VVGCAVDKVVAQRPLKRSLLALSDYVEADWLWTQDRDAQVVLRSLSKAEQIKIRTLQQRLARKKRRTWASLVEKIDRDQVVFREMLADDHLRKSVNDRGNEGRAKTIDGHHLSIGQAKRIWSEYRRPTARLLGHPLPLGGFTPRGRGRPRADRGIAAEIKARAAKFRLASKVERAFARDDESVVYRRGPISGSTPTARSARRSETPVCRNPDEVLAWLALALRNLKRMRAGHSPLPWRPKN